MLPMTQVKVMMGVGSVLVILCSVFLGVFPVIFNSIVDKMLVVRNDSEVFDAFVSPPVPIYMQFWLFNVTNPDEIRFSGAKPVLQEVGPFTYEEVRVKYSFEWDDYEGTVSYLQNKSYMFREDLSNGLKESDPITTINVLMVSLAASLAQHPALLVLLELLFLRFSQTLFIRRAVGDLLFRGYPEPLLAELTRLFGDPRGNNGRFGIFYPVNNTNDKRYEVKTGANGMDDFLNIQAWNESDSLHYWHGPGDEYCNMINGTDGSQYPPRVTRDTVLRLYTSELCRSLYLTYEKDLKHHGIPVYRFIPPPEVLADPMDNHDNLCYCVPDTDHCLGAGMLNLQPCLGLPMILSTPHFYQGDEVELAKLVGLNPSKADHETIIDVEPRTGVAMFAAKKMQLNVPLKPYGSLPSFKNVPEVIFPILWVNESASVNEDDAREVRNAVFVPFVVVDAICGCLIAAGAVLLLVGGFKFLHIKRAAGQQKL
ncbi:lysosome membrane protein 2-like isoform X2 [Eriocheir sinensis]|uniref:lysosome membrane protein 2-like isoform X2 n=1 Tax=Eriocheir sinensis TaxID=95602 RepID=UPI0021C7CE95|nr:lysosome membrane protein 2-like isoform X2 [Eriocheir sinensis]